MVHQPVKPAGHQKAAKNDHQPEGRKHNPVEQGHLTIEPDGQGNRNALRAPDQLGERVETQDEPERGQHMVQVIARVKVADHRQFHRQPDERGARNGEQEPPDERAGPEGERGTKEGANHVEAAMGQIDEIHNAEGQREAGGEQKQQHAKLHPVQELDQNQ